MLYDQYTINTIQQQLGNSIHQWGFSTDAKIILLTVSENATFLIEAPKEKHIIRVHRPDYHTKNEIESELLWLQSINQAGKIKVPTPLPTKANELVVEIADNSYAVAFDFLEGEEPEVEQGLIHWFVQLGNITASLHSHSLQWLPPENFNRKYWNLETMVSPSGYWGDWRLNSGLSKSMLDTIEAALSLLTLRLNEYGSESNRYGLVHADLRLANLLIDKKLLQVIDFDDCGYCWYGYDFAAAISFYETDLEMAELQKSWLKGYRQVATFSDKDEEEMASFILLRRVLLTAWLTSHSETPTAEEFGLGFAAGTAQLAQTYLDSGGQSVWFTDE